MNRHPLYRKEVILAAVVLAAVACFPSISLAQVPTGPLPVITVPGSVTSDPPVEASLTTTTAGGWYQPQASLLGNQAQTLFSGVNPQNATQLMPVTQGLPCDSYTPMTTQIAPALMQTYQAAISNTQQLMTELQGEDFSQIAANVQAPAELAATQSVGQVGLAIIRELQLTRAQLGALTMVIATDDLHQLDAVVRPTMPRSGGGC
jgi:hypothetical protein